MLRHALFLSLLLVTPALADVCPFYIGTYTGKSGSQGIYLDSFDTATGKLGTLSLAATADDPSFLVLSPDKKFIFAAVHNAIGSFALQPDDTLKTINQQPCGGAGTAHVAVDQTGRCAFLANYSSGSITSYTVDPQGRIGSIVSTEQLTGSGPNPKRQKQSYAHSVYVDPTNSYLYSCDLGSDTIWLFKLDPATAKLSPANPPSAKVPPGSGPRHLVFSPDGRFFYVVNEMGNTVSVFPRDTATGRPAALKPIQTISTLLPGTGRDGLTSSEICVSPDGKHLYAATRFIDVFTVYDIGPDGKLKLKQVAPSVVKTPRNFALDPTGQWLLAAGMDNNQIAVLKIDPATGELSPTDQAVTVPSPVCILFDPTK